MKKSPAKNLGYDFSYEVAYSGIPVIATYYNGRIKIVVKDGKANITRQFWKIAGQLKEHMERIGETNVSFLGEVCILDQSQRSRLPKKDEENLAWLVIHDVSKPFDYNHRRSWLEANFMRKRLENIGLSWRYDDYETAWNRVRKYDLGGLIAKGKHTMFGDKEGFIKMINKAQNKAVKFTHLVRRRRKVADRIYGGASLYDRGF